MRTEDFERLYADEAQPLFGYLAYRTGDRGLAEELLGDAFERALRSRHRYDPEKASGKTWLYSIALNCLRDHARRAGAEVRAMSRVGGVVQGEDEELGRIADRDLVVRAMRVLSEEEREVVALRYGGDLSSPQIAKVLGEKLTTVEGRVYRALGKLRDEVEGNP